MLLLEHDPRSADAVELDEHASRNAKRRIPVAVSPSGPDRSLEATCMKTRPSRTISFSFSKRRRAWILCRKFFRNYNTPRTSRGWPCPGPSPPAKAPRHGNNVGMRNRPLSEPCSSNEFLNRVHRHRCQQGNRIAPGPKRHLAAPGVEYRCLPAPQRSPLLPDHSRRTLITVAPSGGGQLG